MTETFYNNTINFSMQFRFTSKRKLTERELLDLHKGLQKALAEQDGPAEHLLGALQEQLEDSDCAPENFEGLGPEVGEGGRPITDELTSESVEV